MSFVGRLFDMPVLEDEYIGIEVELENVLEPHVRGSQFWRVTGDGSLRDNGVEFLTGQPLLYENMTPAMEELSVIFDRYKNSRASCRTGLHIHVNVTDMTPAQVKAMLLISVLVEPGLIWYCGEDRAGNIYSLASSRGDHILNNLQAILNARSNDRFRNEIISAEGYKYSALNIGAICNKGTIEYRMHRGTKSVKDIEQWAEMLIGLRRLAIDLGDIQGVLASLDYIREAVCDYGLTPSCITRKSERRARLLMAPTNTRHRYREQPEPEEREAVFGWFGPEARAVAGEDTVRGEGYRLDAGQQMNRLREYVHLLRDSVLPLPLDEEDLDSQDFLYQGNVYYTGMRTTMAMHSTISVRQALSRQHSRLARRVLD